MQVDSHAAILSLVTLFGSSAVLNQVQNNKCPEVQVSVNCPVAACWWTAIFAWLIGIIVGTCCATAFTSGLWVVVSWYRNRNRVVEGPPALAPPAAENEPTVDNRALAAQQLQLLRQRKA